MIAIGAVYRGPELRGSMVNRSLMQLSTLLKEARGPEPLGAEPWVNVNFVVPGSLGKPNFDYLEYGEYSKQRNGIVVQVPVPDTGFDEAGFKQFLIDSLHGANAMAFEFFRQKGKTFGLRTAEELVRAVGQELLA